MPALPAIISHGTRLPFMVQAEDLQKKPRGLDSTTQVWLTDREDSFDGGGYAPGRPLMRIKEVQTLQQAPSLYQHRLVADGLASARDKIEPAEFSQPEEGWDEHSPTIYTLTPENYTVGTAHPDHPNLYITALTKTQLEGGKVWRIVPSYKGIILDGDGNPKPEKWKGTVNGQNITTSSTVTLGSTGVPATEIFTDEDGVFNGWNDPRKAKFDTSQLNLIVTKLSLTPPPTERLGLQLTPGQIPVTVYSLFDESSWYSSLGFTYNYPAGWKLAGVQFDQVLDKSCFLYTLTFAYQPAVEPIL